MIPFSHAILDDDGEIIRKHRWSYREAKWFMINNPNVKVIVLPPAGASISVIKVCASPLKSSNTRTDPTLIVFCKSLSSVTV